MGPRLRPAISLAVNRPGRIRPASDGRVTAAQQCVEESPGSTEIRCRITSGGGDPRESATESKPPVRQAIGQQVRVKGCGKSAPRDWQQERHGKPHREQDQVGTAGVSQAHFRAVVRVGRVRRRVTGVPDEWSSSCPRAVDRTRLTGHLAQIYTDEPKARRMSLAGRRIRALAARSMLAGRHSS